LSKDTKSVAAPGAYSVELIYKPVGSDPEPLVGGRTTAPAGASLAGCTLEVLNQQSKWRSGKITLKDNGAFQLTVRAEKGIENLFRIEFRDTKGTLCHTEPEEFKYTLGVVVEEQCAKESGKLCKTTIVMPSEEPKGKDENLLRKK